MQLCCVLRLHLRPELDRDEVQHPVRSAVLDRADFSLGRAPDPPEDSIGVSLRLRGMRPLVEVGVAGEADRRLVARTILYGPVPGTGVFPASCQGVPGGIGAASTYASLKRKSGSGSERWNTTVPSLSSTPIPRVSRKYAVHAGTLRRRRCCVVGHIRALDREEAFEGATEIACAKWPAVRIADSRPEAERVRASSVCRRGERHRQIGHEVETVRAADVLERDQGVVAQPEPLERRGLEAESWVERDKAPGREQRQRAAAVLRERPSRYPHRLRPDRQRGWPSADVDACDGISSRIDAGDGGRELIRDPDRAGGECEGGGTTAGDDRRDDFRRLGVDPRDRAGQLVRNPDRAGAKSQSGGALSDGDRCQRRT